MTGNAVLLLRSYLPPEYQLHLVEGTRAAGDPSWWHQCDRCPIQVQGGLAGYLAHCSTVHWDQELPGVAPEPVSAPPGGLFTGIIRTSRTGAPEQLALW
ncbi:hypothetical protein P3T27_007530 [Kitasatospora sp. MAA19]|nr:hypothetical protein [Kitasatospora sp. MAA19]